LPFGIFKLSLGTVNTTLSEQFQNQKYYTVRTVTQPKILHCQNSSTTKNTTLSEQFQNQKYYTVRTVPKPKILQWNCSDSVVFLVVELF
jgi:hypothetical protein